VSISANAAIELTAGSSSSKYLQIQDPEFHYLENRIFDGTGYTPLLQEITRFTNSGLVSLAYFKGPSMSLEMIEELRNSRESLESIDLTIQSNSDGSEMFNLAASCPNLMDLNIKGGGERQTLELFVPSSVKVICRRLSRLNIDLEEDKSLRVDESFFRWVGTQLIEFNVTRNDGDGFLLTDHPLDPFWLHSTLKASIIALKCICFKNLFLSPLRLGVFLEGLRFPNLMLLICTGNLELVNFFARLHYSKLEVLSLFTRDSSKSHQIDHESISRIFRSNPLDDVQVGVKCSKVREVGDDLDPVDEEGQGKDRQPAPNIHKLKLNLEDAAISKFYVPFDYPQLGSVILPPSSRLSQSAFSLGQPQSQKTSGKWQL